MARLARVVVPRYPHHVTQRGNGRARTFFGDADYALYRAPSNRAGGVRSLRKAGDQALSDERELSALSP